MKILSKIYCKYKSYKNNKKEEKENKIIYQKVQVLLNSTKPILLDLGCGNTARKNHIGIDISPQVDIKWNLVKGIPFPDSSISEIRSDHFFEHLFLNEVVFVLKECYRILKKDGILDFTVPHFNPYIDAYLKNDYKFIEEKISDIPLNNKELYATSFDKISWLLHRRCEHRSMFDEKSILHKVKMAGFDNAIVRKYKEQRDPNFRFSSIYILATKE